MPTHFRTLLAENKWPALFDDRGAQLLATLWQLDQSQWWDMDQMALAQAEQLVTLLKHAQATVPFYQEWLGDLDLPTNPQQLLEEWQRVPLLSRKTAQQAGAALYSTNIDAVHGQTRYAATSGSTGTPLQVLSTDITCHMNHAINLREHFWHQRNPESKHVSIRPDREHSFDGVEHDRWVSPVVLIADTGPSAVMHSSVAIDKQVDWLIAQKPEILLSMPSNLRGIAEEIRARGLSLPGLREIRSFAETLSAEVRGMLGEVFDAKITDVYSSVEIGYIGLQCPDHDHYHIQSENALIEILDDADRPCQPGEIGRVVITPLHNFASPLIRYEIGDYAEQGEACGCGRGLGVMRRVMGRERNLLTLPDGSRHWPSVAAKKWATIAPISQFQLVQKSLKTIEIRLIAERKLTASERKQLSSVLSEQFGHAFDYNFTYHDSLVRGRSGKFEDFISELEAGR